MKKINNYLYYKIHRWLANTYGKADHCDNTECLHKSQVFEWANIHEKGHDFKRENYMQLCKTCHIEYDVYPGTREKRLKHLIKLNKSKTGIPRSEEVKEKISKSHFGIMQTEESKRKIGLALKDKKRGPLSDKCKEKIRQKAIERYAKKRLKKHDDK